jgi:UDP-glucose 4-epimerase
VYGVPSGRPFVEDDPPQPVSPYGASKLAGEAIVRGYAHTFDIEAVALRIFNTYGPRQPRYVLLDVLRKLQADPHRLTLLGDGTQVRDYSYVDDTVAAFLLAGLHDDANSHVYNLAGGEPVSIAELVQRLLRVMGLRDVGITYTGQSWKGDIPSLVADTSRLRALGFRPRVDLDAGLARTVDWFRATQAVALARGA